MNGITSTISLPEVKSEDLLNAESPHEKVTKAKKALFSAPLTYFIGEQQRRAMHYVLVGEESQWMALVVQELLQRIENMPQTRESDSHGQAAVVFLHYFRGSIDAWITEKDVCLPEENGSEQSQAFGRICLTGNKRDAELGYISIQELIDNGVELDLYWTPKELKDI